MGWLEPDSQKRANHECKGIQWRTDILPKAFVVGQFSLLCINNAGCLLLDLQAVSVDTVAGAGRRLFRFPRPLRIQSGCRAAQVLVNIHPNTCCLRKGTNLSACNFSRPTTFSTQSVLEQHPLRNKGLAGEICYLGEA